MNKCDPRVNIIIKDDYISFKSSVTEEVVVVALVVAQSPLDNCVYARACPVSLSFYSQTSIGLLGTVL